MSNYTAPRILSDILSNTLHIAQSSTFMFYRSLCIGISGTGRFTIAENANTVYV